MKVDMSVKSVTIRLKRVAQLRNLCLLLSKTKAASLQSNSSSPSVVNERQDSNNLSIKIGNAESSK